MIRDAAILWVWVHPLLPKTSFFFKPQLGCTFQLEASSKLKYLQFVVRSTPWDFFLANDTTVMLPRIFYMGTEQYRTLKCG